MRAQQRHATRDHALEQRIDVGIFRAAQRLKIEPDLGEEPLGVDAARMRRVEHDRRDELRGLQRLEGGIEIANPGIIHRGHTPAWPARFIPGGSPM